MINFLLNSWISLSQSFITSTEYRDRILMHNAPNISPDPLAADPRQGRGQKNTDTEEIHSSRGIEYLTTLT